VERKGGVTKSKTTKKDRSDQKRGVELAENPPGGLFHTDTSSLKQKFNSHRAKSGYPKKRKADSELPNMGRGTFQSHESCDLTGGAHRTGRKIGRKNKSEALSSKKGGAYGSQFNSNFLTGRIKGGRGRKPSINRQPGIIKKNKE